MTQSNTHNATVLVISSQVIDGQVGIQAIAPGLRAFGLGCIGLPTTLLAAHPAAYPQAGPPAGGALPATHITDFAEWLLSAGAFDGLAGVLTGYMPSVEHVEATAGVIDLLRAQKPDLPVCCDPICGDNDRLYLPQEVATALGEHLLPRASIATPNLFELGHLAGTGPLNQTQDAARAAKAQCAGSYCHLSARPQGPHRHIAGQRSIIALRDGCRAASAAWHGRSFFRALYGSAFAPGQNGAGHCHLDHGEARGQKCQ